jgi:hypothetical protein
MDRYRVRIAVASFDGLGNLAAGKFLVSQYASITAYDPS